MVLQGGRKLPPGAFETFLLPGFEYASPIYHKKEGKETSFCFSRLLKGALVPFCYSRFVGSYLSLVSELEA